MPLNQELIITIGGLATDPNPYAAPQGAADLCENIWFPREGEASLRPSFRGSEVTHTGIGTARALYVVNNPYFPDTGLAKMKYVYTSTGLYRTVGSSQSRLGDADVFSEVTLSATAVSLFQGFWSYVEYDGLTYFPTDQGVMQITSPASTTTTHPGVLAGLPKPCIGRVLSTATNGGDQVSASSIVSFKLTYTKNVGTRTVESPPSDPFFFNNTANQAVQVTFRHYLNGEMVSGDNVRLWKSRETTAANFASYDDVDTAEHFLTSSYRIRGEDVANGYIDLIDETPAGDLTSVASEALYTNASELTIAKANWAPPICKVMAEYNGMVFYGNVKEPTPVTIGVDGAGANGAPYKLDLNLGSKTITRVTTTQGIDAPTSGFSEFQAGFFMLEANASVTNPASPTTEFGARYMGEGGDDMSGAASVSTTVTVVWVGGFDLYPESVGSIAVSTFYFLGDADETIAVNQLQGPENGAAHGQYAPTEFFTLFQTGESLAYILSNNQPSLIATPRKPAWGSLHLSSSGIASFDIASARPGKGFYYQSESPVGGYANGSPSNNLTFFSNEDLPATGVRGARWVPGGLYWSNLDNPDAVPFTNNRVIGERESDLLALVPTRDSLFVFKADGTWRISGADPGSISVSEYDRSLILVHPAAACRFNNQVFAWTNQGVVSINENGWTRVSDPLIEDFLSPYAEKHLSRTTSDYDADVKLRPFNNGNALLLCYNKATNNEWLCWSAKTGQWSEWVFDNEENATDLVEDGSQGVLYMLGFGTVRVGSSHLSTKPILCRQRTEYNDGVEGAASSFPAFAKPFFYQLDITTSVSVASGLQKVTFAVSTSDSAYSPAIGDYIEASAGFGTVISTSSSNVLYLRGAAPSIGYTLLTSEAYKTLTARWRSVPKGAQNPGLVKEWVDCSPAFSSIRNTPSVKVYMQSDANEVSTTAVLTVTAPPNSDRGTILRSTISRDHTYATELQPKIELSGAGSQARVRCVSLVYAPVSERVDSRD